MISRLKCLEEEMVSVLELQFENLEGVCTKELGEAIDIVKDLEEAIYYHTITEAMKKEKAATTYSWKMESSHDRETNEMEKEEWDEWLGHSPHGRKRYLEAKEHGKDKATQLRELEKYMQELSTDIVEMIDDASPEEKSYLEKKISALVTKIGQMK
jgi:hypothetical protein